MSHIAFLNTCKDVDAATCKTIAEACALQLLQVAADWERKAWTAAFYANEKDVPAGSDRMWILETPDVADALGYHDVDPHGMPYGRVFWGPVRDSGGGQLHGADSLAVTCSHEAIEMALDPGVQMWSQMPDGRFTSLEGCDACEDKSYDVPLPSGARVSVSDYLLPAWFDSSAHGVKLDKLGALHAPFSMTSGGYMIVAHAGRVSQIFGQHYPEWKKVLKKHVRARAARRAARPA